MRLLLACRRKRVKCLSRSNDAFIITAGGVSAGVKRRGVVGLEMAMTLPERIEAIERVEEAAYASGRARASAVAVHAMNPIIKS